jgi:hypothetical protein
MGWSFAETQLGRLRMLGLSTQPTALFSIRGTEGVMYEIIDDEENIIATLGMQDFIGLHEMNNSL